MPARNGRIKGRRWGSISPHRILWSWIPPGIPVRPLSKVGQLEDSAVGLEADGVAIGARPSSEPIEDPARCSVLQGSGLIMDAGVAILHVERMDQDPGPAGFEPHAEQ